MKPKNFWPSILSLTLMLSIVHSTLLTGKPGKALRVVTSITDLASIAQEVGGKHVKVFSIARGYQDPHFVDAKPSYLLKLQKADMFIQVGLDLETGWVPQLLDGARNGKILPGANGYVDASQGIPLLQVPIGDPATLRAQGDIHASGNPHYWLDPLRGKIIAKNIFEGLARIQPENRKVFQSNLENFNQKIDAKLKEWQSQMANFRGAKIAAFHNSWPYFEERFGFDIISFIEPKPGIPPSPRHLVKVIKTLKRQSARVIIISPYYSKKSSKLTASKSNAQLVELASSVDAFPEVKTYFDLFDYNIGKLSEALLKTGGVVQP